jgi:hypothetical protein
MAIEQGKGEPHPKVAHRNGKTGASEQPITRPKVVQGHLGATMSLRGIKQHK